MEKHRVLNVRDTKGLLKSLSVRPGTN
jgi:hypothetical protein